LSWDDAALLVDATSSPASVLEANADGALQLVPDALGTAGRPWCLETREWRYRLVSHPRLPPVRIESLDPDQCPPMAIIPVVAGASSANGIRLSHDASVDDRRWANDTTQGAVPWRNEVSHIRLLANDETTIELTITANDASSWPETVDQSLREALAPGEALGADLREGTLQLGITSGPHGGGAGLSAFVPIGNTSSLVAWLCGGRTDATY
jgi:hypothetical protein